MVFACNLHNMFCLCENKEQQPYVLTETTHYPNYLDEFLMALK